MSHQILQGGACVACHALTGSFDQQMVSVFGASDGLRARIAGWLRHARKNGFDESIQQGVERLLAPDYAGIVTGLPFETSGNPAFGLC
jgi:hypothetical protein